MGDVSGHNGKTSRLLSDTLGRRSFFNGLLFFHASWFKVMGGHQRDWQPPPSRSIRTTQNFLCWRSSEHFRLAMRSWCIRNWNGSCKFRHHKVTFLGIQQIDPALCPVQRLQFFDWYWKAAKKRCSSSLSLVALTSACVRQSNISDKQICTQRVGIKCCFCVPQNL